MDQPGWTSDNFVRDMPVDFTLLLENLADPDHGVFAHQTASFDSFTASPDHPMAVSAAPGPGGDKARPATGPRRPRTRWPSPPGRGPAATRRAPRRARPTARPRRVNNAARQRPARARGAAKAAQLQAFLSFQATSRCNAMPLCLAAKRYSYGLRLLATLFLCMHNSDTYI